MEDELGRLDDEDDEEGVLLDDPGVLGILDKLAAMRAALFVSGAKRCGRVRYVRLARALTL